MTHWLWCRPVSKVSHTVSSDLGRVNLVLRAGAEWRHYAPKHVNENRGLSRSVTERTRPVTTASHVTGPGTVVGVRFRPSRNSVSGVESAYRGVNIST